MGKPGRVSQQSGEGAGAAVNSASTRDLSREISAGTASPSLSSSASLPGLGGSADNKDNHQSALVYGGAFPLFFCSGMKLEITIFKEHL